MPTPSPLPAEVVFTSSPMDTTALESLVLRAAGEIAEIRNGSHKPRMAKSRTETKRSAAMHPQAT